jgi:cytosine-specific methyltransferase
MIKNDLTYISLFSSAGVGCYGFKMEGFECIATNELIERRLNIQKINKKCKFETGYIQGDLKLLETKKKIYNEITKWKNMGNDKVDVIIATPPCQGMSVANHKKSDNEIDRNSLIRESVNIIKEVKPKFFIFENVRAFWKTGCINNKKEVVSIGNMILSELEEHYLIEHRILNFKNYGSNSSRTRTVVIGVEKELSDYITPLEIYPFYRKEPLLKEVIGDLKRLEWGEYSKNDFYHSFRTYPEYMRSWISDLKQGESAFDNKEDHKKPHKIVNGEIVLNVARNGDKYTRQVYDKVAPCIHTRNDQLASQSTVHPIDDRVFSIRELMRMMTIPDDFKWISRNLKELNNLTIEEKKELSKKEELNIRQSIGEAVPTEIFRNIAKNIKKIILQKKLNDKEINSEILKYDLKNLKNLKKYIMKNKDIICDSCLSRIIELANISRKERSAYYTNKFIVQRVVDDLPEFKKNEITIIEPSVGIGNFLPLLFKKYETIQKVKLILIDIDSNIIELLKLIYNEKKIPDNFEVSFICSDFLNYEIDKKVDLVVGNPPFTKVRGEVLKEYRRQNYNVESTNLSEFILEKSIKISNNVSLIMPKNLLNTPEYAKTREYLEKFDIKKITDFGEKGFKNVLVETVNILISTVEKSKYTEIHSFSKKLYLKQKKEYIFDKNMPYWIIYRNQFFDEVYSKLKFDVFDVFRDRQITNSNSSLKKIKKTDIRVIKSRNINDDGTEILDIENYDAYISLNEIDKFVVKKYLNDDSVYLTPNMTYKPRLMKKEKGYITNGSVAILIPKFDFCLTKKQMKYISTEEFRKFYQVARNYQTRSLNVDKSSSYWFGIYNVDNKSKILSSN